MIRSVAVALVAAGRSPRRCWRSAEKPAGTRSCCSRRSGCSRSLAAHALVRAARRLGGLRRQFAALALLVVAQAAIVVAVFVGGCSSPPRRVPHRDARRVGRVARAVGRLPARGARRSATSRRSRATLAAVALGRRDVRTGVDGRGELADLAADVDAMVARLDGEERARRALVAAVSHDLRTPVTSLRLLGEAIEDGVVDGATAEEYVARMATHVRVLGELIDDLFELTRLESGELRWSMEQVALGELVEQDRRGDAPAGRRVVRGRARRARRGRLRSRSATVRGCSACSST